MDQTKDCTRELIAKAHNNDKEAREKLVTDNLGLINTETGEVKHNKTAETVTLVQSYGGVDREYTLYVTGSEEEPYSINIDASDRSKDVSDDMWGLFFEDINSAADGGLYADMVQNRSFSKSEQIYGFLQSIQYMSQFQFYESPSALKIR